MRKRYIIFLIIILTFSLVACSNTKDSTNDNIIEEGNNKNNIVDDNKNSRIEEKEYDIIETTPKTNEKNEKEVILYFANKEYIETGDENLEQLVPEKRIVKYGDISLEEAIIKELMKGPENDKLNTVIPTTIKLINVEVSDSIAFVNFAQEGLYGGSMEEDFTISQIVNSLLELDNVDKVQFLIDGEKAESLMGHFDVQEPFEIIEN
ncbi:MAG: GerMN domain-containing protein [Tissierellia bacterium]|nr:GerMN domain-containing protein [Tissierellia bacterium]